MNFKKMKLLSAFLTAILALSVVVFLLSGCGKSGDGQNTEGSTPAESNRNVDVPSSDASTEDASDEPTDTEQGTGTEPADASSIPAAEVGSTVKLGKYEQDNNEGNGAEDIEWLVVDVNDGKAVLVSVYALDCLRFYDSGDGVTWEDSSIREWLNGEFFDAAFTEDEAAVIADSTVKAEKNPTVDTDAGADTVDKVFLLSISEAEQYFENEQARQCPGTDYAYANGLPETTAAGCWWWLRTPGTDSGCVSGVDGFGVVIGKGNLAYPLTHGIRPAITVNMG